MRKFYSKIKPSVGMALNDWLINHDNVFKTPNTKDTKKIEVDKSSEKSSAKELFAIPYPSMTC